MRQDGKSRLTDGGRRRSIATLVHHTRRRWAKASKVLTIISTSCLLLIFVVVKNELYGRKPPTVGNSSYPRGSFTSTYTSIESQLQRTNIQDMVECVILPRVLPTGEWFSNIKPLSMPNFTLLSAWLKTESPSAMDAPKDIPEMYMDDFTMEGGVKIDEKPWYFNQAYLGKTALSSMWSRNGKGQQAREFQVWRRYN